MKRLQLLLLWVWMVCFSAASHDYMFKHLEVKDGLSNNQVNAIYKDSNGFMWFGTASGLNRYDGYNIKIYRSQKDDEKSLPDSYVEDIQEDASGNLWIRTGSGYAIYNSASDVFDRNVEAWMWNVGLTGNPSLIYIDKEKTFWIYINGKGVYSYREGQKNAVAVKEADELLAKAVRLPETSVHERFVIVASRSHLTPETEDYIEKMKCSHAEVELISSGSSIKICLVAEGKADVYPRFAPTMEWDTAAGHAIARAAGMEIYQAGKEEPLQYNKEDLLNPWFIVEPKHTEIK